MASNNSYARCTDPAGELLRVLEKRSTTQSSKCKCCGRWVVMGKSFCNTTNCVEMRKEAFMVQIEIEKAEAASKNKRVSTWVGKMTRNISKPQKPQKYGKLVHTIIEHTTGIAKFRSTVRAVQAALRFASAAGKKGDGGSLSPMIASTDFKMVIRRKKRKMSRMSQLLKRPSIVMHFDRQRTVSGEWVDEEQDTPVFSLRALSEEQLEWF